MEKERLLCIGGVFDGQRKLSSGDRFQGFHIQAETPKTDLSVDNNDPQASAATQIAYYRLTEFCADGHYTKLLIAAPMKDGEAFQMLFNSYESVRATSQSAKK